MVGLVSSKELRWLLWRSNRGSVTYASGAKALFTPGETLNILGSLILNSNVVDLSLTPWSAGSPSAQAGHMSHAEGRVEWR